ncbi:MAG: hypothetical protein Q8P25_05190 [Candidatus Curtissbacteria bacterium]|nr:hypothetical protein [Candidatus Curtissbacteria bacterium]
MDVEFETREFLYKEIPVELGLCLEPKVVVGRAYNVFRFIMPKTKEPNWLIVKTSKHFYSSQMETAVARTVGWHNCLGEAFSLVLKEAVRARLLADADGNVFFDIPSDSQQFRFRIGDSDLAATYRLLAVFAAAAYAPPPEIAHYKNMAECFDPN